MKKEKKLIYKPPQAMLFPLGDCLSLMETFSSQGDLQDWTGGSIDGGLEDGLEPEDWFGGGTRPSDNGKIGKC